MYVDKAYQKEIDALEVKCSYYKKGCSWLSTFKELAVSILHLCFIQQFFQCLEKPEQPT